MANYNLTNQEIRNTFEQLGQVSGSIEGGISGSALLDGTGSRVNVIHATASFATTASYALNGESTDTGSLLVTSSAAGSTITFTKGDGTTYQNTITTATATTASLATRNVLTSSAANDTITFTKGDGSTYTNVITLVSESLQASDLFITVKNTSGADIGKGLAVHATGVTGENVNIKLADADIPGDMPAIGLTETAIPNNGNGRVIINGRLKGVDTSLLVAGSPVYVNGAGALSATKPTGSALIQNIGTAAKINASDGEIILQGSGRSNDVPNIAPGYAWVGNSDSVATAVTTSSLLVDSASFATNSTSASHALNADNSISASYAVTSSHVTDTNIAYKNQNNVFTGTQTFNNIAVNGTGSFAYLQSITGSAKVIGDAFIILNNDLPAERYAGIKVLDTGSTTNTASLVWDGQTNDWFYEYSSSATHEYGVVMMGPEYTTQGSPTYLTSNTIPKGNGGHHLEDTNITDDGTNVKINSNTQVTGSVDITGSLKVTGSLDVSGNANITGTTFTSNGLVSPGIVDVGSTSNPVQFPNNRIYFDTAGFGSGYAAFQLIDQGSTVDSQFEVSTFTGLDGSNPVARLRMGSNRNGDNTVIWSGVTDNYAHFKKQMVFDAPATASAEFSASAGIIGNLTGTADSASYVNNLTQDVQLTGSLNVSGALDVNNGSGVNRITGSLENSGYLWTKGFLYSNGNVYGGFDGSGGFLIDNISNTGNQFGTYVAKTNSTTFAGNVYQAFQLVDQNSTGSYTNSAFEISTYTGLDSSWPVVSLAMGPNNGASSNKVMWTSKNYPWIQFGKQVNFLSPVTASADVNINGSLTITGSVEGNVTALSIASQTASIDASVGDYYTLTLVSGSNTHIDSSNIKPGKTFILKTAQPTSATNSHGTISFDPEFKFAGGTAPTATAVSGSEDIYTFVAFDSTNVYSTQLGDLK